MLHLPAKDFEGVLLRYLVLGESLLAEAVQQSFLSHTLNEEDKVGEKSSPAICTDWVSNVLVEHMHLVVLPFETKQSETKRKCRLWWVLVLLTTRSFSK